MIERFTDVEVEPEPILVRFLGKYFLNQAEIVGEEIQVIGVDQQSEDLRLAQRFVTITEIDQVTRWIGGAPEAKNTSLVNFNMRLLQSLRGKMPLSTKPFF